MKHYYLIIIISIVFFGCKNENTSKSTIDETEPQKLSSKDLSNFDCQNFFDEGDYSSVCFSDSKYLKHTGKLKTKNFATYDIGDYTNSVFTPFFVAIRKVNSIDLASHAIKKEIKKENLINSKTINLADESYILEYTIIDSNQRTHNYKGVVFRYKNILITVNSRYLENEEKPCTFSDSELEKFGELMVEKLKRI